MLQVFDEILHRRRKRWHGKKKNPGLRPPVELLTGVVDKVRVAAGHVVKVQVRAFFGRLRAIKARVAALGIGTRVCTSHLERLNRTMRCQQARPARPPRCVSRDGRRLQWSPWLRRDLYNWVPANGALEGRTPAMAAGLSERSWSVLEFILQPAHVDDLTWAVWAEEREIALTCAFDRRRPRKNVPSS